MTEIQTLLQEILKELKEIKAKMPLYSYSNSNWSNRHDCGCDPYKVCMNTHCPRQIRLT